MISYCVHLILACRLVVVIAELFTLYLIYDSTEAKISHAAMSIISSLILVQFLLIVLLKIVFLQTQSRSQYSLSTKDFSCAQSIRSSFSAISFATSKVLVLMQDVIVQLLLLLVNKLDMQVQRNLTCTLKITVTS